MYGRVYIVSNDVFPSIFRLPYITYLHRIRVSYGSFWAFKRVIKMVSDERLFDGLGFLV